MADDAYEAGKELGERIGEALGGLFKKLVIAASPEGEDAFQKALNRARIVQGYVNAERAIETLRVELAKLIATTPATRYSLMDVWAQSLDAMEMSVKQHRITWEHQSAEAEAPE